MITEYKKVKDKVLALDTEEGLKTYEYQDNIEKVLKQENVIEELEDYLYQIENEKDFIKKTKNSFNWMLLGENYGVNAILLVLIASAVMGLGFCFEAQFHIFRALTGILLFSSIPTLIVERKRYKRDMDLKSINIDEEIKNIQERLDKEKKVLIDLKKDKHVSNIDKQTEKTTIDNNKNSKIIEIQKQKHLYEVYREWCKKIQKKKNLDFLLDSETNNDDLENIREMSDRASKVLSKKYNTENK